MIIQRPSSIRIDSEIPGQSPGEEDRVRGNVSSRWVSPEAGTFLSFNELEKARMNKCQGCLQSLLTDARGQHRENPVQKLVSPEQPPPRDGAALAFKFEK